MDIAMDDAEVDASPSPAHQAPCMIPGGENPMLHSWQGFQEDYQRLLATGQKALFFYLIRLSRRHVYMHLY